MPDVKAIESLLLDHQWHKVDLKPFTEQPIALCLRKDGRLLLMDDEQFDLWTRDDSLRTRLDDMAQGRGRQVKGDTQHERSQESITKSKIGELNISVTPNLMNIDSNMTAQLQIAFQEMMQMSPVMAEIMGGDVQSFMQNIGMQMPEGEGSTQDAQKNHEQKIGEPRAQDVGEAKISTVKVEDSEAADQNSLRGGPMLKIKQFREGIREHNPTMSDEEVRNMTRQRLLQWQQ